MMRKVETLENPQPGLFDQERPCVTLAPKLEQQLATLIEGLFLEIAVALATREAGDEQNHR